jgi:hypothetical protein
VKLFWIGALLLVIASAASLVSNGRSRQITEQVWGASAPILPEAAMSNLGRLTSAYTEGAFQSLPLPLRQKLAAKMWNAIELIVLRSLLVWHFVPALVVAVLMGLLEGRWARSSQRALVKIHSPMRFSLAVAGLGAVPVAVLLWIVAPVIVPTVLLILSVFALTIVSIRNVIVHAPTQF